MDRRAFLAAAAATGLAPIITPEQAFARAAASQPGWMLAVSDVAGDIARRPLRRIHGRVPAGLEGTLYRNGPACFRRPGGDAGHWFDGDGLVRAFRIGSEGASLEARFVDTVKRRQDSAAGAVITPGFGTRGGAEAAVGSADDTNAANTALLPIGGELLALWEAGSPYSVDPRTLATNGLKTFRPDLAHMPFLAHPRIEPGGRVWNLGLAGRKAIVWTLDPSGEIERTALIDLPRASYMHDFTATDRHVILVLQPWIQERQALPIINGLVWRPETGTQVMVLDKDDLTRSRLYELPGFFHFHLGDAWAEADGTIRFDVAASGDPRFAVDGARVLVEGHGVVPGDPARLTLITLRPDGKADMLTSDAVGEFPKADPRRLGLKRSLTVHTSGETPGRPLPTGLAVQDWDSGRSHGFTFGLHQIVEETVFVPKPGATAETDAWLVGPLVNLAAGRTELHVFDAAHVEDGPVASWQADTALPAGFHGAWVG